MNYVKTGSIVWFVLHIDRFASEVEVKVKTEDTWKPDVSDNWEENKACSLLFALPVSYFGHITEVNVGGKKT